MKNVGKPCAGEPHARFDGRGLETGRYQRKPRQSPTLPMRVVNCGGTLIGRLCGGSLAKEHSAGLA